MSSFFGNPPAPETVQYAVPTTGQTVVIAGGTTALLVDPAGTLAGLTITLPSAPVNGQEVYIASSQIITALTVNGGTIVGTLTTLGAAGFALFVYSANASKWFRCG